MTNQRRTPQEWQQIIEAQRVSNLSIADFCRQHGLNLSTFYLQHKKATELALPPSTNDWMPFDTQVQHEPMSRQWQIELKLPNGVVLNMSTDG
jgi:transposase-like protein